MSKSETDFGAAFFAGNLEELDREVARLALLCNVPILDPGVIERVLANDASVCGTSNPPAFSKLRNALMMHFHVRAKAAGAIGETQTTALIGEIVERLKKQYGDRLGSRPG